MCEDVYERVYKSYMRAVCLCVCPSVPVSVSLPLPVLLLLSLTLSFSLSLSFSHLGPQLLCGFPLVIQDGELHRLPLLPHDRLGHSTHHHGAL